MVATLDEEGDTVIAALNRLAELVETHLVEEHLTEELDVAALAREVGSTEYHVRRMFSSLAGLPLSEYVRRRRMTVAATDVVRGDDDLLAIAVRYGYGSTEASGRAFRSVHGVSPGDVRRDGGPPPQSPVPQVPPDRRREHHARHPPH